MFERFTQEINNVLDLAYDETQRLGHKEIATVQLLLGLIRQEKGLAAQLLRDAGVTLENARLEVEKIQGRGAGSRKDIPYNQHTMEVFDFSAAEADKLNDSEIDTQHLLLGLLRQTQGWAVRVLQILGIEPNKLRTQVLRKLAEQGHPTASQFLPSPPPANSNGTDSNKEHLALIQKILENPQGSEAEVVRNNPDRIDPELIERVASILEQQKNSQGAELLRGLITPRHQQKTEATANLTENSVTVSQPIEISSFLEVSVSVPKPLQLPDPPKNIEPIIQIPAPTNQEMEKFIFQLVRVTFESKGNEEVVHNFFRENLDQLNDRLPDVLRNWWLSKVPNFDPNQKLKLAKRILAISSLIRKFEGGSRANNLEIALTGYHIIAPVFTEAEYPEQWAIIQNCLGLTYLERVQGNWEENLKLAIACFTTALSFYNKEQFPKERKVILGSLRKASEQIGNLLGQQEKLEMMPQNSERFLGYYTLIEQLLRTPQNQHQTILDESSELLDAELIQVMRGRGEAEKNRGNIQDGELLIAIAEQINETLPIPPVYVESSLIETEICSGNSSNVKSLESVINFESVKIENNSHEEQEKNDPQLELLLQALQLISDGNFQSLYMLLQRNLDILNDNFPKVLKNWAIPILADAEHDEVQNIAAKINCFGEFVILQFQDGNAASKLEIARTSFEIAATVFTETEFPEQSERIQNRLCLTFLFRVFLVLAESKEDFQSLYSLLTANQDKLNKRFIRVLRDWGTTQLALGENLAFASQKILLQNVAQSFFILGLLIQEFSEGDKQINLEISIACYEVAVTFFSKSAFPPAWAFIQCALGKIYCDRIQGNPIENLAVAQQYFEFALEVFANPQFEEQRIEVQEDLDRVIRKRQQLEEWENSETSNNTDDTEVIQSNLHGECQELETLPTQGDEIDGEEVLNQNTDEDVQKFIEYAEGFKARFFANLRTKYQLNLLKPIRFKRKNDPILAAIQSDPELQAIVIPLISKIAERCSTILEAQGKQYGVEMIKDFVSELNSGGFFTNLPSDENNQNQTNFSDNLNPSEWAELFSDPDFNEFIERLSLEFLAITSTIDPEDIEKYEPTDPIIQQKIIKGLYNRLIPLICNRDINNKWLNNEKVVQFFDRNSTAPLAAYGHQYFDFWNDVFNAIHKSEQEDQLEEFVYPILSRNLDKLDSFSAQFIYNFFKSGYTSSESDAWELVEISTKLTPLLLEFPHGNKANKIEIAVQLNLAAIEIIDSEKYPQEYALIQTQLGPCYHHRIKGDRAENLEQAIKCYRKALEFFTKEKSLYFWASSLMHLGNAYNERIFGDPGENRELAIEIYQELINAPELREQKPEVWAMAQMNFGNAYRDRTQNINSWEDKQKNLEDAINCYENALIIFTPEAFPENWAKTQMNLATVLMHKNQTVQTNSVEQAIGTYQELIQRVFTREAFPEAWGMTQINLGLAYKQAKNWESAINCFQNALQVFKRITDPLNYAKSLFLLGWTYIEAKDFHNAYSSLILAVNTMESLHGEIISGDEIKRLMSEQSGIFYQLVIKACLELALTEPDYYDRAIEYVERSKSRTLVELLNSRHLLPKGNIPEPTLEKLKNLRQEIANEQRRLSNIAKQLEYQNDLAQQGVSFENTTPDYQRLNELQRELDSLIDEDIYFIDPNFSFTQKVRPISFSDIKNTLPDNQVAIIEWYIPFPVMEMQALSRGENVWLNQNIPTGANIIYTFITTLEQEHPIVLQTPVKNYLALWILMGSYLEEYALNKDQWANLMPSRLKELAQILEIDKIVSCIPNVNQLILIPHNFLHLLPLHALPLNDGYCLLDHFTRGIRYVPNCQVLELNQTNRKIDFSNFISIQNPTEDLKYTDIEVQTIRQYFQANNTVLAGQKATKQAFLNQSIKNINYLHLSCHGYFNWLMPLQSALLLANCFVSDPTAPADMMRYLEVDKDCFLDLTKCLTLGDIFNLDLRQCQLVTLSACETGLTEVSLAADEYISLPSGFLYAGASNVVASLWTVNDLSTTFLMIKLYENLIQQLKEKNELNVSIALRDAQLWLKQVDQTQLEKWLPNVPLTNLNHKEQLEDWLSDLKPNTQPFQSPYHWAGFCAIGQ